MPGLRRAAPRLQDALLPPEQGGGSAAAERTAGWSMPGPVAPIAAAFTIPVIRAVIRYGPISRRSPSRSVWLPRMRSLSSLTKVPLEEVSWTTKTPSTQRIMQWFREIPPLRSASVQSALSSLPILSNPSRPSVFVNGCWSAGVAWFSIVSRKRGSAAGRRSMRVCSSWLAGSPSSVTSTRMRYAPISKRSPSCRACGLVSRVLLASMKVPFVDRS